MADLSASWFGPSPKPQGTPRRTGRLCRSPHTGSHGAAGTAVVARAHRRARSERPLGDAGDLALLHVAARQPEPEFRPLGQPSTSSVQTLKLVSVFGPKVVLIATSAASRPRAISTRPM